VYGKVNAIFKSSFSNPFFALPASTASTKLRSCANANSLTETGSGSQISSGIPSCFQASTTFSGFIELGENDKDGATIAGV
jgi:hypothetical protein